MTTGSIHFYGAVSESSSVLLRGRQTGTVSWKKGLHSPNKAEETPPSTHTLTPRPKTEGLTISARLTHLKPVQEKLLMVSYM